MNSLFELPKIAITLKFLVNLSVLLWLSACNLQNPNEDSSVSLIEEETGLLYEGAGTEKTLFTEEEKNTLFGSSRYQLNAKQSQIHRMKFNQNVRFLMDLKLVSEVTDMKVEPDKITFNFTSHDDRNKFVKKVKKRSHRFGASFTNRLFAKEAILLGTSKKQRVPFVRKIDRVEKDELEVIVHTKPVVSRMEVFDKISYTLRVPMNPQNMVNKKQIKAHIENRIGKNILDREMFLDETGNYSTIHAEMIKHLERGENLRKALLKSNSSTSSRNKIAARSNHDIDLDRLS